MRVATLVLLSILTWHVSGLRCLIGDEKGVQEQESEEFRMCTLFPLENGRFKMGGVLASQEDLTHIEGLFGQAGSGYSIKMLCLEEEYRFAALGGAQASTVRCLCQADGCNSETAYRTFIGQ